MDAQILDIVPVAFGQRISVRIYANESGLVLFRLHRVRTDEPDIVTVIAGIARGEVYEEAPRCGLVYPSAGRLMPDGRDLEVQVHPGQTDFEVTWCPGEDGVSQGEQVQLLPWVGFA